MANTWKEPKCPLLDADTMERHPVEGFLAMGDNTGSPAGHGAEWDKPDTEGHILHTGHEEFKKLKLAGAGSEWNACKGPGGGVDRMGRCQSKSPSQAIQNK